MWPDVKGVLMIALKISELNVAGSKSMADTYTKKLKLPTWCHTNFELIILCNSASYRGNYPLSLVKSLESQRLFYFHSIDSNLNWSGHIEAVKTNLFKTIGILYKTRYFLNQNSLYYIFKSHLISHVKYGLLCWGRASKI